MKEYDHKKIEKKWQKTWGENKTYKTLSAKSAKGKKPFYVLDMFPYPSGVGLHVGHPRGYIGSDVIARKMRMQGYNVLHPMGYDAFGLPAEQYAIQNNISPRKAVLENVKTFERQLSIMGLSYDWSRKVNTTDPEYYKWTQWIFLKIYDSWFDTKKNKARPITELVSLFEKKGSAGVTAVTTNTKSFSAKEWKTFSEKEKQDILMHYRLAYEGYSEVNWCPELGTVLANDEIVDGKNGPVSERGGYPVEKKTMRQWFMRITAYGDRLLADLDALDWPEHIKEIQKNWIGKSEGSEIAFELSFKKNPADNDNRGPHGEKAAIPIFTTRADTLFGATYMVLAPEHPWVTLATDNKHDVLFNKDEVKKYVESVKSKDEMDRTNATKEKTGVELKGVMAINPATQEEIPIWIADYVLPQYGTGAVMAVPAHDERDYVFAKKYNLPICQVISPLFVDPINPSQPGFAEVTRDTVLVFLRNNENNTYAILHWHGTLEGITTTVMGGIDAGETVEAAAMREIIEETAIQNARFVKKLSWVTDAVYCASHKKENRIAHAQAVLFEVDNLTTQGIIDVEESAKHTLVWIPEKDVHDVLVPLHQKFVWNQLCSETAITLPGRMLNFGEYTSMNSEEARIKITESVGGKMVTKFKFRDAVFARQRYWGEPIPLSTDAEGMLREVPLKKLPLELPSIKTYEPTGTGEGPLATVAAWKKAGYETNTMPGWAGSSWYFLRYTDPENKKSFASEAELAYWFNPSTDSTRSFDKAQDSSLRAGSGQAKKTGGVDVYIGGAEHATGHLLYSRFWHKVLFDYGLVPTKEPFQKLKNQGMILASDGRKMSKRWGNVVNPDDMVTTYGADTLRLYEMFIGPFEASLPWQTDSIIGPRRFIERVWRLQSKVKSEKLQVTPYEIVLNQTIKKVTEDIETFGFNTAVSQMMICLNEMEKADVIAVADYKKFLQLLAPFAPHVAEELWTVLGEKKSVHLSGWPTYDADKLVSDEMTIVVQINGKMRGELLVSRTTTPEEIQRLALSHEKIAVHIGSATPKRVIYVPGRLVNIVV